MLSNCCFASQARWAGPQVDLPLEPAAVPQEELRELVPCGPLGPLGVVAGPLEVADRLGGRVEHVDRREVPRAEVLGELLGVAAVGLDPGPGLDRDQRRGDDLAGDPGRLQPAGQAEPGRPRLVAAPQRPRRPQPQQPPDQTRDVVGDRPQRLRRLPIPHGDGDRDRVAMDVETDEPNCGSLIHGPVLPVSALH